MKFIIKKDLLIKKLNIVSRAISTKAINPILFNFKLSLTSNTLTILASNAEITIVDHIDVIDENENKNINVLVTGECLLPNRALEILKKLRGEEINFELIDSLITIDDGFGTYKFNSIRPEEYPDVNLELPKDIISLNFNEFRDSINQVAFAASSKENQNVLTCVNFNLKDGVLALSATDTSRLARKILRNIKSTSEHEANVPAKVVQDLVRMVDNAENVIIAFEEKRVCFKIDTMTLFSTLIIGNYPNLAGLFKNEFTIDLKANSKDLISAMERLMLLFIDRQAYAKFKISQEDFKLYAKSSDFGSAVETLSNFEYQDDSPFELNVDCNFVIQAIKAFNEDEVIFKFTSSTKPFTIVSTKNPDLVQIVVPVRVVG